MTREWSWRCNFLVQWFSPFAITRGNARLNACIIVSSVIMACIEMRKEDEKNASFVSNLFPRISAWIHTFLQVTIHSIFIAIPWQIHLLQSHFLNSNLINVKQVYVHFYIQTPLLLQSFPPPRLHCTHSVRFHHIPSYHHTKRKPFSSFSIFLK